MTKETFLKRLGDLLACLPADQIEESKAFYAEAIADRMEDGMTEEEAVAALGAPGEVAEAILDDLPAVPRAIAKTRRRSNTLLWVLAIVGSPLWIVLALAFAAVAIMVYLCIWALALCVWIVAAALCALGPMCLVLAYDGIAIGHLPFALVMAGAALAFFGAGLAVGAGAWTATKQIARLSALWVQKVRSPFHKDRPGDGGGVSGIRTARPSRTEEAADAAPIAAVAGVIG